MDIKLGKYNQFISMLEQLHRKGYNDKEISKIINVTPTHFSKIKTKMVGVSDKVLNTLKDILNDNKKIYDNFQSKDMFVQEPSPFYNRSDNFENRNDFYDDEIRKLKLAHKKEVDDLNLIIDHLRFIISEYKRLKE